MGATLSTIMSTTQLSRSTAFRLLRYLTEERMLDFDEQRKAYRLGSLAYEFGLAARGQADIVAAWRDRIDRIAAKTGLTTYLVARSDTEIVCLATAQGQRIVRAVPMEVGQRLPLGIGGGSLAILSSLPDEEVGAILASHGPKLRLYGEGRVTPRVLWQRVETARARGYALSQDSVAKGVIGIGVLIPRDSGLTQLAVSVSIVAAELDKAEQTQIAKTIQKIIQG
jgi:DNA-binding IclR family transcriptional regulator